MRSINAPTTETKNQVDRKQKPVKNKTDNKSQDKSRPEPSRKKTQKPMKPKHHNNQKPKPQTKNADSTNEEECIDLTKSFSQRNKIKQQTLLIGSSILKNIKTSDLNDSTAVRTISGATIEKIKRQNK